MNIIEGVLDAEGKKLGIVVSRFNSTITTKLLEGAIACFKRHGGDEKNIDVTWVPGAFELPATAKRLDEINKYDALICLGAVIRGETSHFEYVAGSVASGISAASVSATIPIVFGVLTVDTLEQALNRSGIKNGNAGYDAATSAIDMASVYAQIKSEKN